MCLLLVACEAWICYTTFHKAGVTAWLQNQQRRVDFTVRCTKGSSDCYTFQANVVNNTSSERAVEWKVVWLDADGMEIDSTVSTWAARMIQPYEVCALKGTAPTKAAVDMMFYVRRAK